MIIKYKKNRTHHGAKFKRLGFFLAMFFVLQLCIMNIVPANAHESPTLSTELFGKIPILHEGRIKPIDSFARANFKALSGKENGALPWMVEMLFDPARAELRPILRVKNPNILSLLKIPPRKNGLYSYKEISNALAQQQQIVLSIIDEEEENWTTAQRDLIILQQQCIQIKKLLGSLTLFLPLSASLPEEIQDDIPSIFVPLTGKTLFYVDVMPFQEDLDNALKEIIDNKGGDIKNYSKGEQALAYLSFSLVGIHEAARGSNVFKVIPNPDDPELWISPWDILLSNKSLDSTLLLHWKELSIAYHSGDHNKWNNASQIIHNAIMTDPQAKIRPIALSVEYYYNFYNPYSISFYLCLIALIAITFSLFIKHSILMRLSYYALVASLIPQISGIITRMYILERPPVSTLYETIIFVTLISMAYMVHAYSKDNKTIWLWLGALSGVLLHILGFSHDQDGDSMLMLAAVLNTNFWLTTHVLSITAGYAFCVITVLLAHYALIKMVWSGQKTPDIGIFQNIHMAALIALFLSTIGTVLGGIWADQSWGRFWGWDPKENGALLIVLWLIWILHGRVSGQMNIISILCGLSYLSVILAFSWFGVNLLGVGLHAYGFSDAAVWGLITFTTMETLFVAIMVWYFSFRKKRQIYE